MSATIADAQVVEQYWPHLTSLTRMLDDLTSRTHQVVLRPVDDPRDLDAQLRHRETMAPPISP